MNVSIDMPDYWWKLKAKVTSGQKHLLYSFRKRKRHLSVMHSTDQFIFKRVCVCRFFFD